MYEGDTALITVTLTVSTTGALLTNATEVQMDITRPDGTVLATRTLSGGLVINSGSGKYKTQLDLAMAGVYSVIVHATSPTGEHVATHGSIKVSRLNS